MRSGHDQAAEVAVGGSGLPKRQPSWPPMWMGVHHRPAEAPVVCGPRFPSGRVVADEDAAVRRPGLGSGAKSVWRNHVCDAKA